MRENDYERAPGYAARYQKERFARGSGPRTHRREIAALAALLRRVVPSDGAWLDVPCGAGRITDMLPQPVVQVDRDAAMLAVCAPQPGRHRVRASALALPFADSVFAGVACLRLLQHLDAPERRNVLRELARVSRGPVLFSYFEARSVQNWRRHVRRALGKTRSGRTAVGWLQLRAEIDAAGLRAVARQSLLPMISEQTLVLAHKATAGG